MRKLTVALLSGAYICIALIAAVLVWRVGGGAGAGSAALIGSLGLCFAVQGLVARLSQATQLAGEIDAVREAHLILAGEIEKVQARVAGMVDTISEDAFRRSEEIYSEVQLLEDVVQQMGERLESQLSHQVEQAEAAGLAAPQASALLATVRAALDAGRVDLYLQAVVSLPQRRTQYS